MATFTAIILKHHIKADKTAKIKICVTHNRERKYLDTGLTVDLSDLKKDLTLKAGAYKDKADEIMKGYRAIINAVSDSIKYMSLAQVVALLTKDEKADGEIDFITFADGEIERLKKLGRDGVAANHYTAINALVRFNGGRELNVKAITVTFLQKFEEFIKSKPLSDNNKGMSRAPSLYMSSIRALHNELKRQYNNEDGGVIRVPQSPFSRYKLPTLKITRKRAIEAELIKKIYDLPYETAKTNKSYIRFNLAKDCFLLSFGLMGINSTDLFSCDNFTKNKLTYNRKKTATRRADEAEICVFAPVELEAIIAKYRDKTGARVFNFYQQFSTPMNFNQSINKGLKLIGKKINAVDLEYYAARHSWATIALNDAKIDKFTVHSALNHVDESMRVTDIYIKKDWSLINNANRTVLDYVFKAPVKKASKQIKSLTKKTNHEN